jgi:hypothetical protein
MWRPPEGTHGPPFWPGAEGVFWPEGRVLWFNTVGRCTLNSVDPYS